MSDIKAAEPVIERKEGFSQVCVWPGCELGDDTPEQFAEFMKENLNVRVQYLETVVTKPDIDDRGNVVPDTGGRHDMLFAVHSDDVGMFAIPRLRAGIRWIEDVLAEINHGRHLYDCDRLDRYKTW